MKRAGAIALAGLLTTVSLSAAAAVTRARYLMGTVCEVTAASDSEAEAMFAEAKRIEGMLSTWRDDSELARVNRGEAALPELRALLDETLRWSRDTDGAFDPRVRALIDAWQIRGDGAVPTDAQLDAAMQRMRSAPQFEEGAFGKGYALDRMLARASGDAVINFGGQLAVRGTTEVTIADPEHRDRPVVALTLANASLSTSSGSEKTFTARSGRRFSHIVDPRTGVALPPRGSVSVIHPSALVADILSTALYVMGRDDGVRWAREHGITAIFIDEQRTITASAPLSMRIVDAHFTKRNGRT